MAALHLATRTPVRHPLVATAPFGGQVNRMRILHILNHIDEVGNGIVNVAVDLACLQRDAGHDVLVCSAGGAFERLLKQHGVQHSVLVQERRPLTLSKAFRQFRRDVRRFRPDIIHAHMMTGAMLARFGNARPSYRLVTHVHNKFQRSAILMGVGDRVIAVSAAVASVMQRRGIPKRKLRVVQNAVIGSPRHQPLASYAPANLKRPAVVTVAGMYKRKGILELIEAFDGVVAQVPDAHLYLVGSGPDRAHFESVASRSPNAHRIHFEGFQKTPQPYLLAADVFVLCSHTESFPLAIIEAREAGCAIVATNVDGIPEALDAGTAGILVPPKDPTSLQSEIRKLICNPDELRRWQSSARGNLSRFHVQRVTQEVQDVYQKLLAGETSGGG